VDFDPVLLARIQFAFVVSFHILFPSFTIGLAAYIAVLEGLFLKTGREVYQRLSKFWIKIFAVSFGMGVVSGIVMSYQFGTNWSQFSDVAGNVIGPLMGYEVVTAFFMEATFLGILLFGRNRVPQWLHFTSAVVVAIGTLFSAFWILSANSWMHTPTGAELRDGRFFVTDWMAVIFNPSFPYRLMHMVTAAFLTTALVVGGVSAWYLRRERFPLVARTGLSMALGLISLLAPVQIFLGDLHGLNTLEHQPVKVAAMEGHWERQRGAPSILFAIPDEEAETNHFELGIPKLGSLILTHELDGEVPGLKDVPREERPPVTPVFWSFRIMIFCGLAMFALGLTSLWLRFRGRLYDSPWFLKACQYAMPLGFIAILAGWFTTEIGRQPWVVYGLLHRADAASPAIGAGSVAISLAAFVIAYTFIFGFGIYYLVKLVRKGPEPAPETPHGTPKRPLGVVDEDLDDNASREGNVPRDGKKVPI
jgi:cytochrome d ubiquinol oxidase subunit I